MPTNQDQNAKRSKSEEIKMDPDDVALIDAIWDELGPKFAAEQKAKPQKEPGKDVK